MISTAQRVEKAHYAIRDPQIAAKVAELKRRGKKILELNIGDPGALRGAYGFKMPQHIKRNLIEAIEIGGAFDGYANEQGEEELRAAVADYSQRRGIRDARAANVIVGNGLSEIIDYLFGVSLERGRNVILPKPNYPLYATRAAWYEAETRYYTLDSKHQWRPNLDEIAAAMDHNTFAVVLINPNNPTGSVIDADVLRAIIDLADEKGKGDVVLISDEIYHLLRFDGREHTATASLTDSVPVITLDGMSKGYYSPGWRIGHALFSNFSDPKIFNAMAKVCSFRLSAANAIQHAYAKGIMEREKYLLDYNSTLKLLQERAAYTSERLNSIRGVHCVKPKGAFYAFPRLENTKFKSDKEFILRLLEEEGVRVVPGSGFEMKEEDLHFRVVTLPDLQTQKEAYDKLETFINRYALASGS